MGLMPVGFSGYGVKRQCQYTSVWYMAGKLFPLHPHLSVMLTPERGSGIYVDGGNHENCVAIDRERGRRTFRAL